ncbi:Lrp/AsnC family transcriptional regulator [Nocardiopsis baichengensis]|uniref:Lrp/AsnC family transcriptional regulator n=1 Tax=Nocardiopsis baichengensis TaxID=280240 RepID=UPI00034C3848|nr:Lrp/AsnC family transcriptional regulator [Nocardiopsis baichengensis]
MGGMELDETDSAIVRELGVDGRLPFETLAGRVGLSRAATRLRVRRMQESGRLRIVGIVHPAVRGTTARAQLAVSVRGTTAAAVAAQVAALPECRRAELAAGRTPLLAEVVGRDLGPLTAAVDRVRRIPGVSGIDTAVFTHVLKDPYLASAPPPTASPDQVDHRLLALLEKDGRLSFAELAGYVGLSPGAVRSRVMRLLEGRALRVTGLLDPATAGQGCHGGFALTLGPGAENAAAAIASWDETRFLTRCLGRSDLVGAVAAEDPEAVREVHERLRVLPGVELHETWLRLEQVKDGDRA